MRDSVAGNKGAGMRRLGSVLTLLLALLPITAFAIDPDKRFDDYVKDVWSIEEGLPQITVLAIAQDADNYMWIGTQAGVARFDGVRFVPFDPENTPAIPGLMIQDIFLDSQNRLWLATYKGVAVYDDGEFLRVPWRDINGEELSIDARVVREDAGGNILVGSVEGLFEYRNGELVRAPRFREGAAYGLLVEDDAVWVGDVGRLVRINGDGSKTFFRLPEQFSSSLVQHVVRAHGALWIGTSMGLFRWIDNQWQLFTSGDESLSSLPVTALYEDKDRNLWVATSNGLARLIDGQQVEFINNDDHSAHPQVRTIYEDHEGSLWLGSHWFGVARLWNGWTRRFSRKEGLEDELVWSLTRGRKGELWVGTSEGLEVLRGEKFEKLLEGSDLPHPHAYTLHDDPERLWIGTRTGLVWYRNGRVWMPKVFQPLATTQVSAIFEDRNGDHWIGANNGLYRYADDQLQRVDVGQDVGVDRIRVINQTREGRLLVGTQAGLYEVLGGRLRKIGRDVGLPENLDITAIAQLDDGAVVIGTLSEQVFMFDDGRWQMYTTQDGLPVNSPFFIAEDSNGFLWVAGLRGLYRVPVEDLHQRRHEKLAQVRGEMLLSERGDVRGAQKTYCCNGAGNAKGFFENDTLWLPTRGGVVAVDTLEIVKNPVPPRIVIESIRHVDESWGRHQEGPLVLPANARDLNIAFTALSLQEPRSVLLKYRLIGYDPEWQFMDRVTERNVSYTNLPPGEYRFEVTGTNNAGVWATEIAARDFTISPYYWETIWFRLLMLGVIALLIFGGYRYQLHNLTVQRARLEKIVRQRTEELRVANSQLQDAVQSDSLTGLRNRRFVQNQLPGDLAFYERNVNEPAHTKDRLVFALADIDHLRRINEDHGPHVGDAILRQFGRMLGQYTRAGDYVVRWDGEKFLMVFRPMESGVFDRIAERIRTAIQNHEFKVEGSGSLHITVSIGFMEMPLMRDERAPLEWEDFIELADHAVYYIKRSGRNGWATIRFTDTTRTDTLVDEVRLHLQALVDNGDLSVISNHGREAPS